MEGGAFTYDLGLALLLERGVARISCIYNGDSLTHCGFGA